MSRFIILFVGISLSFSIAAKTVYKTVNPDGSVTFTDQETKGSEKIEVRKAQTFPAQPPTPAKLPTTKLTPTFAYALSINQPEDNSTINDSQDVTVSVNLSPVLKLGYGHQIRYQLGEQSIDSKEINATFKNVSRGTHTVSVSVIDKEGEAVSRTVSRTFHMKRYFKKPAK